MKDRAEFYPGPARRDIEKVAERVQDNLDTKTTASTEASFEVTGSYTVVGLPPGIPFVYVNSLLATSPLSTVDTFAFAESDNRMTRQDVNNAFGRGTDTMVGAGTANFLLFNPIAGTFGIVPFPSTGSTIVGAVPWRNNRMLLQYSTDTSGPWKACYVEGGVFTTIDLETPVNATSLLGVGPAADGVNICTVWTTATSGTLLLAIHNESGAVLGSRTFQMPAFVISGTTYYGSVMYTKIENGCVVAYTFTSTSNNYRHGIAVTTATATGTSQSFTVPQRGLGGERTTSNITPDGHIFWEAGNDLYRLNCVNGLLEVFPSVFEFDPQLGFSQVNPVSMSARNASELGHIGYITQVVDGVTYYRWAWVPVAIANSVVTSSPVISGDAYTGNTISQALSTIGPVLVRATGSATFQVANQLWTVSYP